MNWQDLQQILITMCSTPRDFSPRSNSLVDVLFTVSEAYILNCGSVVKYANLLVQCKRFALCVWQVCLKCPLRNVDRCAFHFPSLPKG